MAAKAFKVPAEDFRRFLQEEGLDDFYNDEIARRLGGEKLGFDGRLLVKARRGQTMTARSMWKLWVATGRRLEYLRPLNLNPLMEWMFEHDLTDGEIAEKTGIPRGTLADVLYKLDGKAPNDSIREKLLALTGLAIYALEGEQATKPPSAREPVPSETNFGQRVATLERTVAELAGRKEPTGAEILARLLESSAAFLRQTDRIEEIKEEAAESSSREATLAFEAIPGNVSKVVFLILALEEYLNRLVKAPESERQEVRDLVGQQLLAVLGSGLIALRKESEFSVWQRRQVEF